jgi:hypothetical protein
MNKPIDKALANKTIGYESLKIKNPEDIENNQSTPL